MFTSASSNAFFILSGGGLFTHKIGDPFKALLQIVHSIKISA